MPRSAIIWTRSRELSLKARYHRTDSTMISWSKCRPLKRSCAEVGSVIPGVTAVHRSFQAFAPEPFGSGLEHRKAPRRSDSKAELQATALTKVRNFPGRPATRVCEFWAYIPKRWETESGRFRGHQVQDCRRGEETKRKY